MSDQERLHALDAVRAFALLLGIAFHAAFPFIPGFPKGVWAVVDTSPSLVLADFAFFAHLFRMTLFFFIAGYFARLLIERQGMRGFWRNRRQRILIPLVASWPVLVVAVTAIWIVGIVQELGQLPKAPAPDASQPAGAFPLVHLWFLYLLMIFYVLASGVRAVIHALDRRGGLAWLIDGGARLALVSCLAPLLLGLPVGFALLTQQSWVYIEGIRTPDHSLIPTLAAFVGYGTAFLFGWIVHRAGDALRLIQRRWLAHLVIAAAATAVCAAHLGIQSPIAPVPAGTAKVIYSFAYATASWGWTLAITGAALSFCAGYSPARRYLADASYWMYLAHLPLVVGLGVLVGHWPLHWAIKYPLTLGVSLALLLVSYHYLVRPTFIGKQLNGRRYPIGRQARAAGIHAAPINSN